MIISNLHYVIVKLILIVPSHMEDINQSRVTSRNWFEKFYTFKFPLKGFFMLKIRSTDNFNSPHHTGNSPSKPNFTIRTLTNNSNYFIIRNIRKIFSFIRKVLFQVFEFLFSKLILHDASQDKLAQYLHLTHLSLFPLPNLGQRNSQKFDTV